MPGSISLVKDELQPERKDAQVGFLIRFTQFEYFALDACTLAEYIAEKETRIIKAVIIPTKNLRKNLIALECSRLFHMILVGAGATRIRGLTEMRPEFG